MLLMTLLKAKTMTLAWRGMTSLATTTATSADVMKQRLDNASIVRLHYSMYVFQCSAVM
jgi:hypothetical protein